jgi:ketol-acid reductoisomerase
MTMILNCKDVNTQNLKAQKITILGYGSQGRAHALNLRDSGFQVTVGLRPDGPSDAKARQDGFEPLSPERAVAQADVVAMLVPDMAQPELYTKAVAPHLKAGALLLFAHGFNVHYKYIHASENMDVCLVAPKAPGALVRQQYEEGKGVPCLLGVHQDATKSAFDRALAYASGIGGTRAGVLETTFAEETETDLFGEQAVLCGGVTELVRTGYDVLVEAGYTPEVAYFECLHELKLIVDLLHEGGFARLHQFISETATYGDLTRGRKVVDDNVKENMRLVLKDICSGAFAREWVNENKNSKPTYRKLLKEDLTHPLEDVGRVLRSRMAWLPTEKTAPVTPPSSSQQDLSLEGVPLGDLKTTSTVQETLA